MAGRELLLYRERNGSWTAVNYDGNVEAAFSSEQEKDLVLTASGYQLARRGDPRENFWSPETWTA